MMNNGSVLGWNGERLDPVSGATHLGNGYRAYSPALMRFHCPDSLSPFGAGGVNPYAYCDGDPVNRADPSGHLSWQAWTGIGLGAAGLALAAFTAGSSIVAAGGVIAALESASAVALAISGAAVVADVAAIASGAMEECHPQASAILAWSSLGSGVVGVAHGGIGLGRALTAGLRQRLGTLMRVGLSGRGAAAAEDPIIVSRITTLPQSGVYTLGISTRLDSHDQIAREVALAYRGVANDPNHLDVVINMSLRENRGAHVGINGVTWELKRLIKELKKVVPDFDQIRSVRILGRGSGRMAHSLPRGSKFRMYTFGGNRFFTHANDNALYRDVLRAAAERFDAIGLENGTYDRAIAETNALLNAKLARIPNENTRILTIKGIENSDVWLTPASG
ncbi:RHS repeat-associated core domain-containing protein [Chromobacterium vaccinii]|uniref:RHS repeat-associated core domain-containing protein n=1 Tax=Chromobacterium vaccinii TaxID=1108595 RepID=UPI003C76C46B